MTINETQTAGCDKLSQVYCMMFNELSNLVKSDELLNKLSPLDYSSLGLYIGKYVEQEINSSVVQLMRYFCNIDMPEYFCKRCPDYSVYADVTTGRNIIRLNEQKDPNDKFSLKTIPLGEAYYALKQLKEDDEEGFLKDYAFLYNPKFLEAWRKLFYFRNRNYSGTPNLTCILS